MAYRSKVTNKYFGSTYEGRPSVAKSSPLADIANAINRNTDNFQAAGNNYIIGKKQDAIATLAELRANGKSYEEITKIILDGKDETLSNFYAESAVQGQNGRFAAADAIAKINQAVEAGEYDYTTMNLTDFHKKFVQEYKLETQDDNFVLGFSALFQKWQTDKKNEDAIAKGQWHNDQKMQKVVSVLETVSDIKEIMPMLKSMSVELPKLDGEGKKNYFLTSQEENTALLSYATKLYNTAETVEQLEFAQSLLALNRGKGKGGNDIGSLLNTDTKAQDLHKKLEDRITAMTNQNYVNNERAIKKEKEDKLVEIFSETDESKRQTLIAEIIDKYPNMATTINSIVTNRGEILEDKGAVERIKQQIIDGEYHDKTFEFTMANIREATNNWSTISELIGLNQGIQREINEGYGNPVLDSEVIDLNAKLQKIMVQLVPNDAFGGDQEQINQVAYDLVEMEIENEYRQWYAKNMRPPKTAPVNEQQAWLDKQSEWLNKKYAEKVALYKSEEFKEALDLKLIENFRDIDNLDLDSIPQEWADTQIKNEVEKYRGDAIDEIVAMANTQLRPTLEVLMESPQFNDLMNMEGFRKIYTENDREVVAEEILKQLGIPVQDYSDERKKIEDNIALNTALIDMGTVGEIKIGSFEDMQNLMENNMFDSVGKEDVARFREVVLTNLENVLGMTPNFNLIANLSQEAQDGLASMFGITPSQFDELLEFTFPISN